MPKVRVASDGFDYSDGALQTVSGGLWTNNNTYNGHMAVVSGRAMPNTSTGMSGTGAYRYTGGSFNSDQYSRCTIWQVGQSYSGYTSALFVRISDDNDPTSTSTRDGYAFGFGDQGGNDASCEIYKIVNGVYSQLLSIGTLTVASGDTVELQAIGNRLLAFINDILVGQVVDNDLTGGRPGICCAGSSAGSYQFEAWEGGSIVDTLTDGYDLLSPIVRPVCFSDEMPELNEQHPMRRFLGTTWLVRNGYLLRLPIPLMAAPTQNYSGGAMPTYPTLYGPGLRNAAGLDAGPNIPQGQIITHGVGFGTEYWLSVFTVTPDGAASAGFGVMQQDDSGRGIGWDSSDGFWWSGSATDATYPRFAWTGPDYKVRGNKTYAVCGVAKNYGTQPYIAVNGSVFQTRITKNPYFAPCSSVRIGSYTSWGSNLYYYTHLHAVFYTHSDPDPKLAALLSRDPFDIFTTSQLVDA